MTGPTYCYSFRRAAKYPNASLQAAVEEYCVNCKRQLTRYEYAMGACVTCMNEGKGTGEVVTTEDQERSMEEKLSACGVPKRHQTNTAESWRGPWPLPVRSWYGDPWSVYLHGEPGTGKTHVATAILRQWIEANKMSVRWTTVADMIAALKEANDKWAESQRYTFPTLLVLDDLDNSDMTPWAREQVVAIIKRRYQEAKALVLTSNVPPSGLSDFDPSVVSRLSEGIVRKFEGDDYRLKAGR